MVIAGLALLAALVAFLKRRPRIALANLVAIPLWFGWLQINDDLPGLLAAVVVIGFLAVISVGLFGEADPDSPWAARGLDVRVAFAGRLLGVFLMVGLTVALTVLYIAYDIYGGAVIMGIWAAIIAWTFVPKLLTRSG